MSQVTDFGGRFRVISGDAVVIDFGRRGTVAPGTTGTAAPGTAALTLAGVAPNVFATVTEGPPVVIPLAVGTPFVRPLLDWRAADLTLAPGTLRRGGSASAVDSLGNPRTVPANEPRFEALDLDGDVDRESLTLLVGGAAAPDIFSFPFDSQPGIMGTIYVCFIERLATRPEFSTVFAIANTANATPSCRLYSVGNQYRFQYRVDPNSPAEVSVAPIVPFGAMVEVRAVLDAAGAIYMGQSINGGAEVVSGRSQALGKGANWSSPTSLWVGSINGTFVLQTAVRAIRVAAGERTLASMRRRYPLSE